MQALSNLRSLRYLPVKRVEIPKPTGGFRPLGIPIVLDRLIQQVSEHRETPVHCADTFADL